MSFSTTIEEGRKCIGFQQMTGITTAQLLAGTGSGEAVLISVEGNGLRYRLDGVDPTSTVGGLVAAGGTMWYVGDLKKFKVIQQAAGTIVNVHVFE